MEFSSSVHDSKDGVAFDFFASVLTRESPAADLESIELRSVPEYIRELRDKTEQWKGKFLEYQDCSAFKYWRKYEEQYKEEVKKHKNILKNLDDMRRKFVTSDSDSNYFTQLLDADFVQALVEIIKQNQRDEESFYRLMTPAPGMPKDFKYMLYVVYAFVATYEYGEFRMRPPPQSGILVKPWATLVQLRGATSTPWKYGD